MSELVEIIDDDNGEPAEGYVCSHRKARRSEVFVNPLTWKAFCWALWEASYTRRFVSVRAGSGVKSVELLPGQFVYGRHRAAKECHMPESTMRNQMAKLVELGCIKITPDSTHSIVTICNWNTYQPTLGKVGQPEDRSGQREDSDRTLLKKGNKVKKDQSLARPDGFADWWQVYPRKVGKRKAVDTYAAAIKRIQAEYSIDVNAAVAKLLATTTTYAEAVKSTEAKFIPYPASWLNAGRYDDDPNEWKSQNNGQRNGNHDGNNSAVRPRTGRYDSDDLNIITTASALPREQAIVAGG